MKQLPPLTADLTPLVTYTVGEDEMVIEAIVGAFEAIGANPHGRETTLHEWIDPDYLERLHWDGHRPLRVSTVIWDYPTVITSETVEIYDR